MPRVSRFGGGRPQSARVASGGTPGCGGASLAGSSATVGPLGLLLFVRARFFVVDGCQPRTTAAGGLCTTIAGSSPLL